MTTRCARCADENTEGEGLGWQKESSSFVLCFNRSEAKRVSNMKRAAATIATPTAIFSTAPLFFSYPSAGQTSNHTRTLTHISNNNSKKLTRKYISFASILRAGILI